jgi:hypothetical protein
VNGIEPTGKLAIGPQKFRPDQLEAFFLESAYDFAGKVTLYAVRLDND